MYICGKIYTMKGDLRLRIELVLLEQLKKEAKELGLSISAYVRMLLIKRNLK